MRKQEREKEMHRRRENLSIVSTTIFTHKKHSTNIMRSRFFKYATSIAMYEHLMYSSSVTQTSQVKIQFPTQNKQKFLGIQTYFS